MNAAPEKRQEILLDKVELPQLTAGTLRNYKIDLGRALDKGVIYQARIPEGSWDEGELELSFYNPEAPLTTHQKVEIRQGDALFLRAKAKLCCPASRPLTKIHLEPRPALASAGKAVFPVVLPLSLPVRATGECGSWRLAQILQALMAGTLALYLHGMFANSFFLSRRRLALRLKPLRWNGHQHVEDKEALDVQQMIDRDLGFWRRAWNWIRSNPLTFGLPGRAYYETVELVLAPQPDASQLNVKPKPDVYRELEKAPDLGRGGLFITARGERFFGVPQNGELSGLVRRKIVAREKETKDGRVDLERGERLFYKQSFGKQLSPFRSGWEVL